MCVCVQHHRRLGHAAQSDLQSTTACWNRKPESPIARHSCVEVILAQQVGHTELNSTSPRATAQPVRHRAGGHGEGTEDWGWASGGSSEGR